MQAALEGVEGVSKVEVTKSKAVVTAGEEVKVAKMIKAVKKAGFGAKEEVMEKG